MKLTRNIHKIVVTSISVALAAVLMTPTAFAEEATPGYNTK
ncbi:hypothetical protein ACLHDG_07630 [Sulfurovum sp. CS9]